MRTSTFLKIFVIIPSFINITAYRSIDFNKAKTNIDLITRYVSYYKKLFKVIIKYLFFYFHQIKMSNPIKSINTAADKEGEGGGRGAGRL